MNSEPTQSWRRGLLWGLGLVAIGIPAFLAYLKGPSEIHETTAVDSPYLLRELMRGGTRPFRFAYWRELIGLDDERLNLRRARMQWSTAEVAHGYLYSWDPRRPWQTLWEFAPCDASSLRDMTAADLNRQFYAGGSAGGSEAFGHRWQTNSVLVNDGTVILCRLARDRTTVYALEIASQDVQRARFRFKIFEVEPR
jgi:hypothetical protein